MLVKIECPMWGRTYDMTQEAAIKLMLSAYQLAEGETAKAEIKHDVRVEVDASKEQVEQLEEALKELGEVMSGKPAQPAEHGSRNERMFGKRETWATREGTPQEEQYPEGWKGFMIIRCPECGEVRTFFTRERLTKSRCNCGCEIELDDMLPAYVNCGKCGKSLKYRTNIRDEYPVTVNCLDCGSPIDMQVNPRGTAMVPVESLNTRGGGH